MEKIAQGDFGEDAAADVKDAQGIEEPIFVEDVGVEPPIPQFVLDLPNISHMDL
jgi:splicing factor 3A subunit 1